MLSHSENRAAPRLIVNADDFGLTENVNRGIIKAHHEGIVTSASIMANGPAFDDACRLATRAPSLDFGIHLTLVGEAPLSPTSQIPMLLGPNQMLLPHARSFLLRYLRSAIDRSHLRRELEAQIVRVLEAGVNISHIDSHQHIHVLPGVLSVVNELAVKYGIGAIRWPREAIEGKTLQEGLRRPGRLAELMALRLLTKNTDGLKLRCPERFFGFFHGGRLTASTILFILQRLRAGEATELMCHPGQADSSSSYKHWGYHWAGELRALTDPEVLKAVRTFGIELVGFRDLGLAEPEKAAPL